MEMAWSRQLEVMEIPVGWLTQDNVSHPAHNPSLDVADTTDNVRTIPVCLCGVLLSWHVTPVSGFMRRLVLRSMTICLQTRPENHRPHASGNLELWSLLYV
jgi:hypothetical protein